MRMVADSYQRTHSPSWLAWSECWRPPGVQSAFIKRTRWTLAVALSQYDSSTINIVLYIILSYYMSLTACLYNVRIESTVIGIYWFIYEKCKSQWLQHTGNDTLHFLQAFSSGALAGSVSCTCVCGFTVWPVVMWYVIYVHVRKGLESPDLYQADGIHSVDTYPLSLTGCSCKHE